MKTLIVAEHDNQSLKAATLNAVAAAQQLGGDIDVLVVGSGCQAAADAAASVLLHCKSFPVKIFQNSNNKVSAQVHLVPIFG